MSNELGKNEVLVQFNGVGGELLQFHAAEVTVYSDARPRYPRTDIIWVRIKALFGGTYKIAATSIQPLFNGSHDRSIANVIKFTEGWNVPFKVADLHVYGINLPVFPHPKKETLTVDVKMDENMKETVEGLKELLRLIDKNLLDHGARINEMKTVLDHMGVRLRAISDKVIDAEVSSQEQAGLDFLVGGEPDPYLVMAKNAVEQQHRQRASLLRDAHIIVGYEVNGGLSPAAQRLNELNKRRHGAEWESALRYVRQNKEVS
jgi:hypothetical protein